MGASRVRTFLDERGIAYETQEHPVAYAAQEVAAAEHVSGWAVAKPVVLHADGQAVVVVAAAPVEVDLDRAREGLGASDLRLASEDELSELFPDCEVGAVPAFGNLYDLPVYLDASLRDQPRIVCRDGSHTRTVSLALEDFVAVVGPTDVDVTRLPG